MSHNFTYVCCKLDFKTQHLIVDRLTCPAVLDLSSVMVMVQRELHTRKRFTICIVNKKYQNTQLLLPT